MSNVLTIDEWEEERERLNAMVLAAGNLGIKRFFSLDHRAYQAGALDTRTKEMLGLVASLVLRCDDCVTYHVSRCHQEGIGREEIVEAMNVALVVGGSIVIPHLRRAIDRLVEIEKQETVEPELSTSTSEHPH